MFAAYLLSSHEFIFTCTLPIEQFCDGKEFVVAV